LIDSASSGRLAHSTVDVLAAASDATVVPHEPAPMTATLIDFDTVTHPIVYGWRTLTS
jgi:hypothetical protein